MKETELTAFLESCGVSTTLWGQGGAKTVADLLTEIEEGETELALTSEGIIRRTSFLRIHVFYKGQKLKEKKQVFKKDGTERVRNVPWSVGERLKANEADGLLIKVVERALHEELQVGGEFAFVSPITCDEETKVSPSYPGLNAHFKTFTLDIYLSPAQYKPEGYVEVQEKKTTHFEWVPAE